MTHYSAKHETGVVKTTVSLPGSKSESNRHLILNGLSGSRTEIANLSAAADTVLLEKLMKRGGKTADVKDCGTCLRFLIAYFCALNRNKVVTGSPRLCERPVGALVSALRDIGFKLNYVREEGFPPLEVIPVESSLRKPSVTIDGSESSQYLSALAMIATTLPEGLSIQATGKAVSRPYLDLTLGIMRQYGIGHAWEDDKLKIARQPWKAPAKVRVGADWSAASAWYAIAALSNEGEILLADLDPGSVQGDRVLMEWMPAFGVKSSKEKGGVLIRKTGSPMPDQAIDFSQHPDLAPGMITLAAALNLNMEITGVGNLRLKESDRLAGLATELRKVNAWLELDGDRYTLKSNYRPPQEVLQTYDDHRMAMAFAPLAMAGLVRIEGPDAVNKSYPGFWDDLKTAGFEIE